MTRRPATTTRTPAPAVTQSAPKQGRAVLARDHELQVMSRMADLYATLSPTARIRVHSYMGERLDALPTIAAVQPPPVPTPLFNEPEQPGTTTETTDGTSQAA